MMMTQMWGSNHTLPRRIAKEQQKLENAFKEQVSFGVVTFNSDQPELLYFQVETENVGSIVVVLPHHLIEGIPMINSVDISSHTWRPATPFTKIVKNELLLRTIREKNWINAELEFMMIH